MKSFLQLLALTASVLTFSPITTNKTNDMANLSINLQDSISYENPWTADENNGACNGDEQIYSFETSGVKYAQCMPRLVKNCPMPSNFDKGAEAMQSLYDDIIVCMAECSYSKTSCLEGSTCMTAPDDLKNSNVQNICQFKQTGGPAPPGPDPKPPAPTPKPTPSDFDHLEKRMDEVDSRLESIEKKINKLLAKTAIY